MSKKSITLPKVCILILNWNGWRDTIECLESVFRNTYPNYQIIIIDNGSTNGSMEKIKAWAEGKQKVLTPDPSHPLYHLSHPPVQKPIPYIEYDRKTAEAGGLPEKEKELYNKLPNGIPHPLILIQTEDNLGFAGGNNVGISYALAKDDFNYILLLNNDTVVNKGFLKPLVEFAESDHKAGIIGPRIVSYDLPDKTSHGAGFINWNLGKPVSKDLTYLTECDFVTGACILIKSEVFERLDALFPEEFFLYWEETDFCMRSQRYGYKTYYFPKTSIAHKVSSTIGIRSNLHIYYMQRNRVLFMKKNAPIFRRFCFFIFWGLIEIPRLLLSSVKHNKGLNIKEIKVILMAALDGLIERTGGTFTDD